MLAADPSLGLYGGANGEKGGRGSINANKTSSDPHVMNYRRSDGASRQESVEEVYRGELLTLAEDLGRRLLPAFDTPTGG